MTVVSTYFVSYPQIFPLTIMIEKASQACKSMSYNNNWLVRWLVPSFLYLSNLPVCLRIQFPEGQRAPKSVRKRDIATTQIYNFLLPVTSKIFTYDKSKLKR